MFPIQYKHWIMPTPDEMDQKGRLLHAVNGVAEILLTADEERFVSSLREGMELMARCIDIDRIYIWQNKMKDGRLQYIQQFEWLHDSEPEGKTISSNTGFSYDESFPEWKEKFLNRECVNGPLRSLSHTERKRLKPYGIKSILVVPVYLQDCFWGFVSFDDCHNERIFTEDEVSILRSGSLMIASAVNRNETAIRLHEADERAKLMLNAMPLSCTLWNKDIINIDCNEEAIKLFAFKNKQEYLDRFFKLSPKYQPDGSPSFEKAKEYISAAFRDGRIVFEWMHRKLDGTLIPSEVTLVRVRHGEEDIVSGYTRDLREHKKMMKEIEYKDALMRTVNDVAAILLQSEADAFENDLMRCMGMMADSADADRMYISKNYEKDGQLYCTQLYEWSGGAEPQQGGKYTMDIPYSEETPAWKEKLPSGQCINGPIRDMSPVEKAHLSAQGVLSILVVPVFLHDQFWGFVGFDDCHRERVFSEDEESILRSGSLLMTNTLLRNETATRLREADERAKLMLDATPLCCTLWDRNFKIIECNEEVVKFFELGDKQEFMDKFFGLLPEYQPDGRLSIEKGREFISAAFHDGRAVDDWIYQKLDGTPIPSEATFVRIKHGEEYIVAGYLRDLREYKKMMMEIEYKDALLRTANNVATILLRSEVDEFEDNLYRCMGMLAESVGADRMYICKNHEKDGQLYSSQLYEWSEGAEPQQENMIDVSYSEKTPGWEEKFLDGRCINAIVCGMSPEEQAQLCAQGILSILVVPVSLYDQLWGFVGLDDCHRERIFSEDEESVLRSISLIISNALLRNEMTRDLHAAVEQAQTASEAKSAFVAHMSHEIRSPMNVIVGMTELILREDMSMAIYEHVLNIKQAGANMLSLINDILDFSKIEAGSLEIVSSEYSLTSLINNVLIIIRMKVSEKPILFAVNIDCNIPNRLIGDETRIRQILLNVLDNAVKYTNEGFVSLTVTGEINEDTVVITAEISDSGAGIKKEDLDQLFDNFVRFDSERNRSIQGTGLGLTITRSLCQAMGGNISVRSKYEAGSTFIITIPQKIKSHEEKFANVSEPDTKQVLLYEMRPVYADSIVRSFDNLGVRCTLVKNQKDFYDELKLRPYPFVFVSSLLSESVGRVIEELKLDTRLVLLTEFGEAPVMRNVRTIATPLHSASIANILDDIEDSVFYNESGRENVRFISPSSDILVVDDLNTNLKVAQGLMLPYQMQVDVCLSGEEAITYVRKKQYDIIFMDHMMPEMDGIEATARIRSLEDGSGYYGSVPIIALTANAVSGVKEMFLQNGMNDFLAKPIDVTKLHGLLEKWIPAEKKEKFTKKRIKKPSDMNPVEIEIEEVDIQAGIVMTGGAVDSYLKTLAVFHVDGLDKINQIRDCVEKNDIKLYTVYVHAMKSSAANIGAREVSDLFKTLEMAGTRGDDAFIRGNTEPCLEKLEALLKNINATLSKNQGVATKETDMEFLRNELMKLKEALDNRDAGEIDDIMSELETVTWNQQSGDIYKEISRNILLINYTEAAVLVDELLMG